MKKRKKGFVEEFKEFALRGNVLDMAVGIVIGVAFSAIVNSLVADIIMPVVGLLTNNYNFARLVFAFSDDNLLTYGSFIEAILNFFLIALALFIIIKFFNRVRSEMTGETEEKDEPEPTEIELLTEIRDLLKNKEDK